MDFVYTRSLVAVLATLSFASCGGPGSANVEPQTHDTTSQTEHDVAGAADMTRDLNVLAEPDMDPGLDGGVKPDLGIEPGPNRTPLRTNWPPGLAWVRSHPMFVSGLVVQMNGFDANFVNTYYDDFGASAIHLWRTGLPDRLTEWLAVPRPDHRWLTWLDQDGMAGSQLAGGVAPNAAGRIGFQIGDEPRELSEFAAMKAGVDAVRAHDPEALIFINMSHYADELDQMMADQCDQGFDLFSYDDYSLRQGSYARLEYFRKWGLQCDKPYWRYMNSFADTGRAFPSPTDMRWQALSGLVYGFTGHTWFLYQIESTNTLKSALFVTTGDLDSAKSALFDVAAELNHEMTNYGRVVARLQSTDVRYVPAKGAAVQPNRTTTWTAGAGNDPYLIELESRGAAFQDVLIGFFDDNYRERYVMLQNPNHAGGSGAVSNDTEAVFTLTFDFKRAPISLNRTAIEHFSGTTGEVTDVLLNDNQLEINLRAGDVYLFKYATGAPWDVQ